MEKGKHVRTETADRRGTSWADKAQGCVTAKARVRERKTERPVGRVTQPQSVACNGTGVFCFVMSGEYKKSAP